MADRSEYPRVPRRAGEKHGWLRLESYQEIHESALDRHHFVVEDRTGFIRTDTNGTIAYRLQGEIRCIGGIVIEVSKEYEVRLHRGHEEIRGLFYRYTALAPGHGSILRYDNLHREVPDEFHRHLYDLRTGMESRRVLLTREEMPTFVEIIDEVERIASDAGLLDSGSA